VEWDEVVIRVNVTIRHRSNPATAFSLRAQVNAPENGRLKCTTSLPKGVGLLTMADGGIHPNSGSDAICSWCRSGAAFAMNRLNLTGFDINVDSIAGTCSSYPDIQGVAAAASAAMFLAHRRTEFLALHLGGWDAVNFSCEESPGPTGVS
jgi:hypothetical protein